MLSALGSMPDEKPCEPAPVIANRTPCAEQPRNPSVICRNPEGSSAFAHVLAIDGDDHDIVTPLKRHCVFHRPGPPRTAQVRCV